MRGNHSCAGRRAARSLVLAMSVAGLCVFGDGLPSVTGVVMKQTSQKRVQISYALSAPCAVDARVKTVALSAFARIDTLHGMGSLFLVR